MQADRTQYDIETHPWHPWLPEGAKVLFMGTFPPGSHRWSMDFYYPNPGNDFWRIMGLIFEGDPQALYIPAEKRFDLDRIKRLTLLHGIAMSDTVKKARRLRGNASDKYLEVIQGNDPADLLVALPQCTDLATTGEKAADVIASLTGTEAPAMGHYTLWTMSGGRRVRIWRLPSTSRAYPLKLERKAEFYRAMLKVAGVLHEN